MKSTAVKFIAEYRKALRLARYRMKCVEDQRGLGLGAGDPHYRSFVGPPERYDLLAALQFNLLTSLGLREYHSLLDIGCGSLRAGRLFMTYLLPGNYCGVEPEQWL